MRTLRHSGLLALVAVMLFAWLLYLPGLASGFMLDDYGNLDVLEQLDGEDSGLREWQRLLDAGNAGPLGRPIALLTFGLQHEHWPDNPQPFKIVNLAIHFLVSILLFLVARRLMAAFLPAANPEIPAFLVAAIWLLLPIHVSTVLYVVQRMAMLAAGFVLAGLYFYLACRQRGTLIAAIGAIAALAICGLLGVLSKESAVVLLPLIIMLEWLLHIHVGSPRPWRLVTWSSLTGAAALLLGGFLWKLPGFIAGYANRPFTLEERLLTQPGVLLDYLGAILAPNPTRLSIFHDSYPVEARLADALPSLLVLALLVVAAILARKRIPLFTAGILWYLLAHSLESSVVALEMYFEHRNYLPSAGILLALFGLLHFAITRWAGRHARWVAGIVGLSALLTYASLTSATNVVWSNPVRQAILWTAVDPGSLRARLELVKVALRTEKYDLAHSMIVKGNKDFPDAPYFGLYAITSRCNSNEIPLPDIDDLVRRLTVPGRRGGVVENLSVPLARVENGGECPYLDPRWLESFLAQWQSSETDAGMAMQAGVLLAKTRFLAGKTEQAIRTLHPIAVDHNNGFLMLVLAEWSIVAGDTERAEEYLDRAATTPDPNGNNHEREMHIREQLRRLQTSPERRSGELHE